MTTSTKPKPPSSADTSNRWFLVAIIVVFVLGALGVAIAANAGSDDEGTTTVATGAGIDSTAPVTVDGEPLAPMPSGIQVTDASTDAAVGQIAPTVAGTDFAGTPITIEPDGTPKVVMFVAHWCPHCGREVPVVVDLIEQGKLPPGLEVVAVSTAVDDGAPNYPPNEWLADENWNEPVLRDSADSEVVLSYGSGGFPYVVYLDGDNRVVARSAGELDESQIEALWLATANA